MPYLVVLSGEDFVNEFGPDGHLTNVGWGAVSRMLNYKEGRMYGNWQIRWRHIFDLRFVVRSPFHKKSWVPSALRSMANISLLLLQLVLMYRGASLDFEYMNTMMSLEALRYRLQWAKKVKCHKQKCLDLNPCT